MDWDKLRIFHAVAEAGSLTHAAGRLGITQSALSRQIKTLEKDLGAALFTRHARGLVLTQAGKDLYDTAWEVTRTIERTERKIAEAQGSVSGTLRVTTMLTFGSVWLTQHIRPFMERYPDLKVELRLSDTDLDLSTGEAEVAIQLHEPDHAEWIARPLTGFTAHIYASPDYLDSRGTPVNPEDLLYHDIISFGKGGLSPIAGMDWFHKLTPALKKLEPKLMVDNLYGVMHAAESGVGVCVLPDYLVRGRQNLVRILPMLEVMQYRAYYCYVPELKGTKRVGLFYDFLREQAREETGFIR